MFLRNTLVYRFLPEFLISTSALDTAADNLMSWVTPFYSYQLFIHFCWA